MNNPVFCTSQKSYPSYNDVFTLVKLSGFETIYLEDARFTDPSQTYIILSPQQPPDLSGANCKFIWWSLEYGGEYEPDLSNWHGEVWASDPTWAKAHNAKMVVMGSHPKLADAVRPLVENTKKYDALMLAYMTPRREVIRQQLADLSMPAEIYPGYGLARDEQLVNSKLMLHVHQHDDVHAIAPQRIALAAAYKLPLICESVPDAGAYGQVVPFVTYANLNAEVRSRLAMMQMGYPQEGGNQLHQWLCVEHTFRMSVEEALK